MKRFAFEFESLLKLKQQVLQMAEINEGQRRCTYDACCQELERRENELNRLAAAVHGSLGAALSGDEYEHRRRLFELQTRFVDEAAVTKSKALVAWQEATRNRQRIQREVEGFVQLKESKWRAYRTQLDRARQVELSELILRNESD